MRWTLDMLDAQSPPMQAATDGTSVCAATGPAGDGGELTEAPEAAVAAATAVPRSLRLARFLLQRLPLLLNDLNAGTGVGGSLSTAAIDLLVPSAMSCVEEVVVAFVGKVMVQLEAAMPDGGTDLHIFATMSKVQQQQPFFLASVAFAARLLN